MDLGCLVEDVYPDLAAADEVFLTMRAFQSWTNLGPLLAVHRAEFKPEAIREIEDGATPVAAQISNAMVRHGQILESMRRFQDDVCLHALRRQSGAAVRCQPSLAAAIEGVPMPHYIAWMKSAYWITTTFRPAISVPAGFTPEGLPVGVQIVGRHRDDLGVLQLANAFEIATGIGRQRPHLG